MTADATPVLPAEETHLVIDPGCAVDASEIRRRRASVTFRRRNCLNRGKGTVFRLV